MSRQGHEPVVIVPLSEWEGMKETLQLLSTPANARRLRDAMEQLDAGQGTERDLIVP